MNASLRTVFDHLKGKKFIPPKPPQKLPRHLKKYPTFKFKKGEIIRTEKVPIKTDFSDVDKLPMQVHYKKKRMRLVLKEVRPPQHDYINFKSMAGNEILYNMINSQYFRTCELVHCFNEFSKRIILPQNKDFKDYDWDQHEYVKNTVDLLQKRFACLNLRHVMATSLALDRIKLSRDQEIWAQIEKSIDRLLHKLKPNQIVKVLDLLSKQPNRSNKEFMNKLLTILPIHINTLSDRDLLNLISICIKQNMINERLFNYFIYPRLEFKMSKFSFKNYVHCLRLLGELNYEEDPVFWNEHVLPGIFNFHYNLERSQDLWNALMFVKVNCPTVETAKFILLLENLIKNLENMKESGQDISNLQLILEKDMTVVPSKTPAITFKKIREAESRLKDQAALRSFMETINSQNESGDRVKEIEESINKLLDIKDWKKAKYEMNYAELEKARAKALEAEKQKTSEAKAKITTETDDDDKSKVLEESKEDKEDVEETNKPKNLLKRLNKKEKKDNNEEGIKNNNKDI